jgi:hypothetical protein
LALERLQEVRLREVRQRRSRRLHSSAVARHRREAMEQVMAVRRPQQPRAAPASKPPLRQRPRRVEWESGLPKRSTVPRAVWTAERPDATVALRLRNEVALPALNVVALTSRSAVALTSRPTAKSEARQEVWPWQPAAWTAQRAASTWQQAVSPWQQAGVASG